MTPARARRVWTLRTSLSVLLVVTMLLTFSVVGSVLLANGIPELERARRLELQHEVTEIGERIELMLQARQTRLALLEFMLHELPIDKADAVLERALWDTTMFRAIYRLSPQGRLLAVGLPPERRMQRDDVLGMDLSSTRLFQALSAEQGVAWSGKFLSGTSGTFSAALAVRGEGGYVMMAEVPSDVLLGIIRSAAGKRSSTLWVVDGDGEIVADTKGGGDVARFNIRNGPLMQALLQGRPAPASFQFEGRTLHAAVVHAPRLGWYFIAHAPTGLANPQVLRLLLFVFGIFGGCLLVGLLIAPFWAARMARPLQNIVARAEQTTAGEAVGVSWPRGAVAEFNSLSGNLETMAAALQEREQKSQAIFHAAPVPMAVTTADKDPHILDVNQAWCGALGREREEVIGRRPRELNLFRTEQEGIDLDLALREVSEFAEARLLRGDGEEMLAQVYGGRPIALKTGPLMIWAAVDIGPMRRIEHALRVLNLELEARVGRRTEALAATNADLSLTVEQLRTAQAELVRAEKMAALGNLVAGVAHELNTPLGNGVLAVSAMADATRSFKAAMQGGLKRSDLQQLVDSMEQGSDIAARNLRRAADLVQGFKQVAVDQTSSQRRRFELGEVVHEMVISLRPSFSRTPYRIEVDVPATGLRLDSYPGALGQAIGNLVQNAVLHGFDGRDHGTVRITAEADGEAGVVLRVADDGKGIAAADIGRIFDPFMTTKMGRGGTGLGLHISYNAVVNLLGGTFTVHSEEGCGAVFTMRLPQQAPLAQGADAFSNQF